MPYFLGLSIENKRDVVKKYIKHYGGLFAGIEGSPVLGGRVGCFYYDNNAENSEGLMYFYDEDRSKYEGKVNSYYPLGGNHAITVVGWNDNVHFGTETGAFLVMNSWGFETTNSYSFFYIPYSYENFYKHLLVLFVMIRLHKVLNLKVQVILALQLIF
jgi:C1A family cysteine protease